MTIYLSIQVADGVPGVGCTPPPLHTHTHTRTHFLLEKFTKECRFKQLGASTTLRSCLNSNGLSKMTESRPVIIFIGNYCLFVLPLVAKDRIYKWWNFKRVCTDMRQWNDLPVKVIHWCKGQGRRQQTHVFSLEFLVTGINSETKLQLRQRYLARYKYILDTTIMWDTSAE